MSDYASGSGLGQTETEGSRTVTAFFDTRADAERATSRLQAKGVVESNIHLTEGAPPQNTDATRTDPSEEKGFFESIGDFFFPEEDRHTYAEGLSRGGFLLTVHGLSAGMYDTAIDILDDEGAVDIDERAASWRSEGWAGYQGSGVTAEPVGRNASDDETVPVIEERLRVGKRDTSHGRVRIRSYVHETPVSEEIELRDEHVEVERRPVDRPANIGEDAFRERSIEAEERVEEAVVSKEARVIEEVGLRKESGRRSETISDTVRHTEVEIEDDREAPNVDKTKRR